MGGRGHGLHICYAIALNCIWGLAFAIPQYLSDVDPTVVALGRYFVYGVLSAGILLTGARAIDFSRIPWMRAFAYAFLGHLAYYVVLVWAISLGGIMVVAPIMATLPVSVAVVGNLLDKEVFFRRLILPLLLILVGVVFLRIHQNGRVTGQGGQARDMAYAALLAFGALSMWTAYAVLNARYLKRSEISSVVWAQAMGLCCLLQVGLAIPLWLLLHDAPVQLFDPAHGPETFIRFLAGVVVLGVLVSWFATQLWNKVSRKLPVTVAGQLLVVQSLAGIAYGSWLDRQVPPWIEIICVALVVVGVAWGVKVAYEPRAKA